MLVALPGLALAALLAVVALGSSAVLGVPGASPLLIAIVFGMALRACVGVPAVLKPGFTAAMRHALRLGVALLGLQLTIGQLASIGGRGVAIAAAVLLMTVLFTRWLGRVMGVEGRLAVLIAAGTSICGASAIIGANSIARAGQEDVSYAMATVTFMGLLLMMLYPPLSVWLRLSSADYGVWVGASVHEVAQVVAAGFERDVIAGQIATIVKLTRVLLLAPALILFWHLEGLNRAGAAGSVLPVPWFVVAFVLAAVANSFHVIPATLRETLVAATPLMLTTGLAAVGMETDLRALARRGLRPFLLALAATSFIAVLSLFLIELSSRTG